MYWHLDKFVSSANAQLIKINSNGYPQLDPNHERLIGLVEKVYDLVYDNSGVIADNVGIIEEMIANSRVMTWPCRLFDMAYYYRGVEYDYGVIPYPKYDEFQEKYCSSLGSLVPFVCIPNTCEKTELAGAFMEAMASESYRKVTPVFFDIVLDVKSARDEETLKMLDIIRNGAYMSFETAYSSSVSNVSEMMYNIVWQQKSTYFASWYEKNEGKISESINKFIEKINAVG